MNAGSLVLDGAVNPLSLRTNCNDAARISSSVAGGWKLNSVLMLRHMGDLRPGAYEGSARAAMVARIAARRTVRPGAGVSSGRAARADR